MKTFTIVIRSIVIATTAGLLVRLAPPVAPLEAQPPHTLREWYGLPPVAHIAPSRTALVLVDFQREFFDGHLPLPGAQAAAASASQLLRWSREHGVRVAHVTNIAARRGSALFRAGSPEARIVAAVAPAANEPTFVKAGGGAFASTQLEAWLRAEQVDTIIIAGLMTHLAVYLSATDGSARGFHVLVASDATASRDLPSASGHGAVDHREVERAALAALADRFADVRTAEQITALPLRPNQ